MCVCVCVCLCVCVCVCLTHTTLLQYIDECIMCVHLSVQHMCVCACTACVCVGNITVASQLCILENKKKFFELKLKLKF